jgi:hypothetical protein
MSPVKEKAIFIKRVILDFLVFLTGLIPHHLIN